jgi:hypothetical protein
MASYALNKALHRTPHTVALFAKKRKKTHQHATPVNAALCNREVMCRDLLKQ